MFNIKDKSYSSCTYLTVLKIIIEYRFDCQSCVSIPLCEKKSKMVAYTLALHPWLVQWQDRLGCILNLTHDCFSVSR